MNKIILYSLILFLMGCSKIETKDPRKAYNYWLGQDPPQDMKLIKGEYYQTPHFSLEYELFLKFESNTKWFGEFVKLNQLERDTLKNDWARWTSLPDWFQIDTSYLIYTKDQNDEFERSRYFINPTTGMCYVYETIGM